jgi:site-specific DNA-cytosine methylase
VKLILDLCGGTGSWSKPYQEAGYDVRLITLPNDDVRLYVPPKDVHGILAAPPCTEFSFAKHYHGKGNYTHNFAEGLSIIDACIRLNWLTTPQWFVLENPKGYLRKFLGPPRWTFDPWQYGDPYQKKTDLWGYFNMPTPRIHQRPKNLKKFSLLKSKEIRPEEFGNFTRTERRAMTPAGFAKAFFEANP